MEVTKTTWPTEPWQSESSISADKYEPPQFSFCVGWNTARMWKPFLSIIVWRWRLQVGWLITDLIESEK